MQKLAKSIKRRPGLYLLMILPAAYFIIFRYVPMGGLVMAFMRYNPIRGFSGSQWVGFDNFTRFFNSFFFGQLIWNTFSISMYQLIFGFPIPIILAISINEAVSRRLKRTVQMVTYAPYFISTVVMVSIILQFLSPHYGIVNFMLRALGRDPVNFMGVSSYFKTIFVITGIWQNMGYASIVYIAALSAIDPQIVEAAIVDGASKFKRIIHIDIPFIMPTAITLLILNAGRIMSVGFERIFLMQNPMNLNSSEVISTYVYKIGLLNTDYSFATAIGLFNSVINLALILIVNNLAKKYSEVSLF
jgi:putative aldouronate transport system permease protein